MSETQLPSHPTVMKKIIGSTVVSQLQIPQKARIQVTSNLTELPPVLSWFEHFNHYPINQETWMQCQLALAEGFTNAVRHAHRGQPPTLPIEIEVSLSDKALEIRIWDCGPAFDFETMLKNLPPLKEGDAEGGRGLPLLKKISSRLSYDRYQDDRNASPEGFRNCLLIVKNYGNHL